MRPRASPHAIRTVVGPAMAVRPCLNSAFIAVASSSECVRAMACIVLAGTYVLSDQCACACAVGRGCLWTQACLVQWATRRQEIVAQLNLVKEAMIYHFPTDNAYSGSYWNEVGTTCALCTESCGLRAPPRSSTPTQRDRLPVALCAMHATCTHHFARTTACHSRCPRTLLAYAWPCAHVHTRAGY